MQTESFGQARGFSASRIGFLIPCMGVLARLAFLTGRCTRWGMPNNEIKRRSGGVAILRDEAPAVRPVGLRLMDIAHTWDVSPCHFSQDIMRGRSEPGALLVVGTWLMRMAQVH